MPYKMLERFLNISLLRNLQYKLFYNLYCKSGDDFSLGKE